MHSSATGKKLRSPLNSGNSFSQPSGCALVLESEFPSFCGSQFLSQAKLYINYYYAGLRVSVCRQFNELFIQRFAFTESQLKKFVAVCVSCWVAVRLIYLPFPELAFFLQSIAINRRNPRLKENFQQNQVWSATLLDTYFSYEF